MKKIIDEIKDYLSETNLRWLTIHTMILNRLPITLDMKKEYEETEEKLNNLITKAVNQALDEVRLKREKFEGCDDWVDGLQLGFDQAVDQLNQNIKNLKEGR